MKNMILKFISLSVAAITLLSFTACKNEGKDSPGFFEEKTPEVEAREFIDNMYELLNTGKYEEYANLFDKNDEEKQAMISNYTASEEFFETTYKIESLEAKLADDVLLIDLIYLQDTKLIALGTSNTLRSEVHYALKKDEAGAWKISTYISGESTLISENNGETAEVPAN